MKKSNRIEVKGKSAAGAAQSQKHCRRARPRTVSNGPTKRKAAKRRKVAEEDEKLTGVYLSGGKPDAHLAAFAMALGEEVARHEARCGSREFIFYSLPFWFQVNESLEFLALGKWWSADAMYNNDGMKDIERADCWCCRRGGCAGIIGSRYLTRRLWRNGAT